MRDLTGSKRGPAAVLANPKVQEAAVEKGIEVAGKLVDKQLQIIDDAQQKAADFLKKEVSKDDCSFKKNPKLAIFDHVKSVYTHWGTINKQFRFLCLVHSNELGVFYFGILRENIEVEETIKYGSLVLGSEEIYQERLYNTVRMAWVCLLAHSTLSVGVHDNETQTWKSTAKI